MIAVCVFGFRGNGGGARSAVAVAVGQSSAATARRAFGGCFWPLCNHACGVLPHNSILRTPSENAPRVRRAHVYNTWMIQKLFDSPVSGTCSSRCRRVYCPPGSPSSCACKCLELHGKLKEETCFEYDAVFSPAVPVGYLFAAYNVKQQTRSAAANVNTVGWVGGQQRYM